MCDQGAVREMVKYGISTGIFAGFLAFVVSFMITLIQPLIQYLSFIEIRSYEQALVWSALMGGAYGIATMLLVIQSERNIPVLKPVKFIRDKVWTTEKVNGERYYLSKRFGIYVKGCKNPIYYIPFIGEIT